MDAASLVVRISAEGADGAISAIKNVGSAVDEAGRKLMGIGDTLMGFGTKLTAGVTVPLMAMGLVAVKDFAKFESAVTVLELHAGSAGDAFGGMSDVVLRLGSDVNLFGVEATNAALALTDFYKQGLTTNEILGDLQGYMAGTAEVGGAFRASVDMAAASGLDLNRSSQIVLQTMKQFQLPFSQAAEVVDTLVRAANAGSAEVGGLAEGLAVVGPYARQAGFSIEDTAIALGILADRGIRGSDAGTMLRSILTQITSTAKPTVDALHELGVELFTLEGTGPMKELPVIFQELSDAMADLNPKEQMRILNQLADTRAISGLALQMSEGAEGWSTYAEKMQDAVGAGEEAAARIDTLTGSLAKFGDAISTLKVAAMEGPVEDTLRPLIDGVTELVSSLSQLDPDTLNFGVKIAAGLAAIGPGLLALGALAKVAGLAAVGLGAIASPIGLVVGGVIALAAAMGPLNGMIEETFNIKLPTLGEAFLTITDNVNTLRDAFRELGTAAGEMASDAAEGLSGLGENIIVDLPAPEISDDYESNFVSKYVSLFEEKIGPALSNLNVFSNLADIGAFKDNAATMAAADAQSYADAITTEFGAIDWSPAVTGMMAGMESVTVDPVVGTELAESVNQTIIAGMESVTVDPAIGQGIMDQITSSLDAAGLDSTSIMAQLFDPEALAMTEIDMTGLATAINTSLAEALPAGMEGIDLSGVGEAIAGSLGTDLSTALAGADFSSVGASLATAFQTADLSGVGAGIVESLTASITAAAGALSGAGAAVVASLSAGITGAIGSLSAAGAAAAASFAAGVSSGTGAASAAGAALAAAVTSAVGSIDLSAAGASAGASLAAGLLSQVGAVAAAAAALSAAAKVSTKKELEMKSPSRVFMEYGQLAAQGFAMGLSGAGVGNAAPRVVLNINGASFGQQAGGAGLMRAIDDYLRLNGTLSRV